MLATGAEPGAHDRDRELRRLEDKKAAGAELVMTQPVYDPRTLERFLDDVAPLGLPVMVGILPLASARNAEFLHDEVPGMPHPGRVSASAWRRSTAGPAARAEGIRIAQEALAAVKDRVAGAYVMPPFNRVDAALAVLEVARGRWQPAPHTGVQLADPRRRRTPRRLARPLDSPPAWHEAFVQLGRHGSCSSSGAMRAIAVMISIVVLGGVSHAEPCVTVSAATRRRRGDRARSSPRSPARRVRVSTSSIEIDRASSGRRIALVESVYVMISDDHGRMLSVVSGGATAHVARVAQVADGRIFIATTCARASDSTGSPRRFARASCRRRRSTQASARRATMRV